MARCAAASPEGLFIRVDPLLGGRGDRLHRPTAKKHLFLRLRVKSVTMIASADRRGDRVRRREFLALSGGLSLAWPVAARAQQRSMPVIGYLGGTTFEMTRGYVAAFHRGLADAGYTEGRNVAIEYRWAEGHNDRLPELAADLVRRDVTII